MRFNLDKIFVADRGLIVIGAIIVFYSILCMIGVLTNSFIILLLVFYNSMLTVIFLSIFAMATLSMNDNLINWIDNHWDIIRNSVFSYDMNKFKDHVTTEINSLGIFSLTINATQIISMVCITNLLKFKNIIIALSPLTNLIFSVLSAGMVFIGFYSQQYSYYTTIPTWSSNLLIVLGFFLLGIGILGYKAVKNMNRKLCLMHAFILMFCIIFLLIACVGFFSIVKTTPETVNNNWPEIHQNLKNYGYEVRKSYIITQIQINLKFAGFYSIVFIFFSILSLLTSFYQHYLIPLKDSTSLL
jgi:hypothetical protein